VGTKLGFFLEEKAVAKGKLITEKRLSINKVGHALYELDDVFRKFTGTAPIMDVAKKVLGFKEPLVVQSMYICKQPFIGGAVSPHQDGTFLFTKPESVSAFWFPIDDATLQNACLWVVPGSHNEDLRTRMKVTKDRNSIYFEPPLGSLKWPDDKEYIPVEVKKGAVVLIHGHLAHKSSDNLSDKSRHAYTFHLVDGITEWDSENWLQRPTPFAPLKIVDQQEDYFSNTM